MTKKCNKFAASFIPRWGEYFACVLDEGHGGECRPGGTCVAHGEYSSEPHKPPFCPECQKNGYRAANAIAAKFPGK